MSILLIC